MSIIDLLRAGSLSRSADEITRLQALVEKAEAQLAAMTEREEKAEAEQARWKRDYGLLQQVLDGRTP